MSPSLTLRTNYFFAAQLVTSATNFSITLALARALTPAQFGAVAIVWTLVFFVVSFQRTVVGDSLLVFARTRGELLVEARTVVHWSAGVTTALVLAVSLTTPQRVPWYFAAAAALLLAQDGYRYVAVAQRHATRVLSSDCIWLTFAAAAALLSLRGSSLDTVMRVWLLGGLLALLVLIPTVRKAGPGRATAGVVEFFRHTRKLSGWLALQYVVSTGAIQLALIAVALLVGDADYGGFRAVQLLVAPVLALVFATTSPTISWLANRGGPPWMTRQLLLASGAFGLAAAVPSLVVLGLSDWLITTFPGPAYLPYADLVLPTVLAVVAVAIAVPAGALLRQLEQGRRILVAGLVGSVPGVILSLVAAWRYGIVAVAWVLVVQYLAIWAAAFVLARRSLQEQPQTALPPADDEGP